MTVRLFSIALSSARLFCAFYGLQALLEGQAQGEMDLSVSALTGNEATRLVINNLRRDVQLVG
jgi:hypothetical protein